MKRLKCSLRRIVGPPSFLDDAASLAAYAYDSSLQSATPDFVLFPQTADQIAEIVKLLHGEGFPYVARGAGTNLSGGSVPVSGGAVIALGRLKRIVSIEPENFCARVEPGVTNLELQEALARTGHFFAPDPASQKVSTVGGNVAENSGGPRCLKYGVTTNHILGATVVTPEGDIVKLGSDTLDRAGLDLLGLFIGSEGTLGIATEITCRILPLPKATRTMLAAFDSTEQASRTVSDIIAAGIVPATLEMMDNMVIRAVEDSLHAGYPTDAAAVLIIEIDGVEEGLTEVADEIERVCRRNGLRELRTATSPRERDQLWAGRRGAFGAVARLFPNYSVSDGTVPRTKLPEVLGRVAEIGRKYDLQIGNVFHAGDGNLHPLIFFDSRNRNQVERVHLAGAEILQACTEAGGTISGEHGVGSEKIESMPLVFGGNELKLMRRIKQSLDRRGVCNPAKILPAKVEIEPRPGTRDAITSEASATRFPGVAMYAPEKPEEVAALLYKLAKTGRCFAAIGSNTLFEWLPMRGLPDVIVDTRRLHSIVDHDAANLTVTVQSGVTAGDLREKLVEKAQFLPLDAPADATIGGAIASALSGPRSYLYGAARDLVLGLTFVAADGRILKAGGKTVKNVAGYDFGKLLIGSWGKLGIITEVTFRLVPLPIESGALAVHFEQIQQAREAAGRIQAKRLNPAVMTLTNAPVRIPPGRGSQDEAKGADGKWGLSLFLGAEGTPGAVRYQLDEMAQICTACSGRVSDTCHGSDYELLVADIVRACYSASGPESDLGICGAVRCGDMARALDGLRAVETECGLSARFVAHMARGLIYVTYPKERNAGRVAPDVIFRKMKERLPLSYIIVLCAGRSDSEIPFITENRSSSSWATRVRECFDPDNLMSPGLSI